jgi:hypothetical protein
MKKILCLIVLAATVLWGVEVKAQAKTWDFTVWSEATLTNLAADAANWTAESANRYGNLTAIAADVNVQANAVDIADLAGIQFSALGAGNKLRINHSNSSASLGLNGGSIALKLLDCKKGDEITITFVTASNGTARGFTLTNVTGDNAQNSDNKVPTTNTYTVEEDAAAVFTTTAGVNVSSITRTTTASGAVDTLAYWEFNEATGFAALSNAASSEIDVRVKRSGVWETAKATVQQVGITLTGGAGSTGGYAQLDKYSASVTGGTTVTLQAGGAQSSTASYFITPELPTVGKLMIEAFPNGDGSRPVEIYKSTDDGATWVYAKTTSENYIGAVRTAVSDTFVLNIGEPCKLLFTNPAGGSTRMGSIHIVSMGSVAAAVTATPEAVDLSSPQGDGAEVEVAVKANAGVSGDLTLALKIGGTFTIDKSTILLANAQAGDTVKVTLPTTAVQGEYKDTLVISGGGLAEAVTVPIAATVSEADNVAPVAVTFSPEKDATNVPADVLTYVVFNEPIAVANASGITIDDSEARTEVSGDTLKIMLNLVEYAPGPPYVIKIDAAAVTDISAQKNPIEEAITWSFTIDNTAPELTDTTPAEGAQKVAINIRPSFTFNEKVELVNVGKKATIMPGNITATLDVGEGDTVVVATPDNSLEYNTEYTLTILAFSIEDISGNDYAESIVLHFTTKAEVQGLFYTDFATAPDEMEAGTIGMEPVTKGGVIMGGHASSQIGTSSSTGLGIAGSIDEAGTPAPTHLPEVSAGWFSSGGNKGYITLPEVQGPCMIYFYHSANTSKATDRRGWFLTNNGLQASVDNAFIDAATPGEGTLESGIFFETTDAYTYIIDSFLYTESEKVTFTFTSGRNVRMYDILVRSVEVDEDAPVLTFTPANGAEGVASDAVLRAEADKPMFRKNSKDGLLTEFDLENYVTLFKGSEQVTDVELNLEGNTITVARAGGARWENGATYTLQVDTLSNEFGYTNGVQEATFTIVGDEVLVTAIAITSPTADQEIAVGQTLPLEVQLTPANATDLTVTWSVVGGSQYISLDAAAPSITGVLASGRAAAELQVRANGADGNLTKSVYVYVTAAGSTGIAKSAAEYGIVVSPNPTNGLLNVQSNVALKQVKVFSAASGAMLQSLPLNGASVDLSALAAGSYIVLLFPENGAPAAVQVVKQ